MSRVDFASEDLFEQQWHLRNTGQSGGTPGVDINVVPAWADFTGAGVSIAVNDTGVDPTHPDLAGNLDTTQGGNFIPGTDDPGDGGPDFFFGQGRWHGTGVASMAAADDNGSGLLGAAPDATLVSLVGLGTDAAITAFDQFDVVNASWGQTLLFADNFKDPQLATAASELEDAVANGRGGLGTNIVFASGNDFNAGGLFDLTGSGFGDANFHNFQNSRFTIPVAALDDNGTFAAPGAPEGFTTPGAPVLVSAPGTEVLMADLPGFPGQSFDEFTTASGTSFAAPLVSGVVALMLEANPELGFRDVQEILALSARQNDPNDGGWMVNAAGTWNGGGLHSNLNYGFGLVDARAAVRLAETWEESDTLANEVTASAGRQQLAAVDDTAPVVQSVEIDQDLRVEHVELDITLSHDFLGDVSIFLESPSGTVTTLMSRPGSGFEGATDLDFVFTSNEFLGESARGTWTLTIIDDFVTDDGVLFDWTLSAFGSPADGDDTYVYTDEFATFAAQDASRTVLNDTAGKDRINAAALTGDAVLDLRPGASGTIAGQTLEIGPQTLIEEAVAGDGDDLLIGNQADNRLEGGRGNDELRGGAGVDTAMFRAARDAFTLQTIDGGVKVVDTTGRFGTDLLVDIERAVFEDGVEVALGQPTLAAADDRFMVDAGGTATLDVLANDPDGDAPGLSIALAEGPANGTATVNPDGSISYTPAAGFDGVDSLVYTLTGADGATAQATATIDVTEPLDFLSLSDIGQVTAIYVGYFDRAPDPVGLDFWLGQLQEGLDDGRPAGQVLDDISESFRLSDEAQGVFPFLAPEASVGADRTAVEGFVTEVFDNLFDRAPDDAGLDFWTDQVLDRLDQGINLGDVITDIIAGARDGTDIDLDGDGSVETLNDATVVTNKLAVGEAYALSFVNTPAAEWTVEDDLASAQGVIDRTEAVTGEIDDTQITDILVAEGLPVLATPGDVEMI